MSYLVPIKKLAEALTISDYEFGKGTESCQDITPICYPLKVYRYKWYINSIC